MAKGQEKTVKHLYGPDYVGRFEREQSPHRIRRLMQFVDISEESDVADFGCGNGMLLDCLAGRIHAYSGVDISEHFIRAARDRQKIRGIRNAEFHCEPIGQFCSRNPDAFDAGFVLDLSEHMPDEEWVPALAAIRTALKPAGKLYLHTPNGDFFLERMKMKNFIVRQFPEHVAVRTVYENIRMLEQAGFTKYDVVMLPHYNVLRFIHGLSFLPVAGRYFQARIFIIAQK